MNSPQNSNPQLEWLRAVGPVLVNAVLKRCVFDVTHDIASAADIVTLAGRISVAVLGSILLVQPQVSDNNGIRQWIHIVLILKPTGRRIGVLHSKPFKHGILYGESVPNRDGGSELKNAGVEPSFL